MAHVEAFIKKFHNLEGYLLKEKKKSLFLFLDSHKHFQGQEDILREINLKLIPKTYLEEIYKLEFLLYFRRTSELLQLLQEGNDVAASKIIRQSWFLKSIFGNVNPLEFIKQIFDKLSIVVREKILHRMIREISDESIMNELFNYLLETYGLKPALVLLPGCSVEKIKEFLQERELKLSKAKLKLLYDKDPTLISFYYEEFYKKGGNLGALSDISDYLAKVDSDLFVNLRLKYRLYGNPLGRKATKKYVMKNKAKILENPEKYVKFDVFRNRAFVRVLGNDFPKLFKVIFPTELSTLMESYVHLNLLNQFPKKKRYELYSTTFEEVFERKLLSSKDYITPELLEVIQSSEEREKWVEKFENDLKYLKYKRAEMGVAELKEHLFKCDDTRLRAQMCGDIVLCCSINHDYDSLLDTLKLFTERFRNADVSTVNTFLDTIINRIKLCELNPEHWKYIHGIILILKARGFNINRDIIFEYCRFLYKSGESFEDMIPIMLQSNFGYCGLNFNRENFNDRNFEKQFIQLLLKHLSGVKNENNFQRMAIEIIMGIKRWNRLNPKSKILVAEDKKIVEAVKKGVDTTWVYSFSDEVAAMKYLVCRENLSQDFVDIYFNHLNCLENANMTRWFMKNEPQIFENKLDDLMELVNVRSRNFQLKFFKKYEHTELANKIVNHYLERIKNPDEDEKVKIATLLASVMRKDMYLKILEEYIPTIDKLDLVNATDDEKNLQSIQTALVGTVPLTNYHADALPILLKYCNTDCFQNTLFSLYSCFNHVPENTLRGIAEKIFKSRVTVRKHSIFLAAMAFPMEFNNDMYQKIISSEENQSIKKHLFVSSYKYFLKNPLDKIWTILTNYMDSLTVQDIECLLILTDAHVLPRNYKNRFIEKALEVFERLEKDKPMNSYYDKLMEKLADDDIKTLSNDLCVKMISSKLLTDDNKVNNSCIDFAIKFMLYSSDIRNSMQNVMEILGNYKSKHLDTEMSKVVKSLCYNICRKLFQKVMNKKELRIQLTKEFAIIFSKEWKRDFEMQESLEEYLMIELMSIKYEDGKDLNIYAKRIQAFINGVISVYGDLIIALLGELLPSSLRLLLGEKKFEVKLIKLLEILLRNDSSVPFCLLAIKLLPLKHSDDEFVSSYEYILKEFANKPPIVGVYLNKYFKKMKHV